MCTHRTNYYAGSLSKLARSSNERGAWLILECARQTRPSCFLLCIITPSRPRESWDCPSQRASDAPHLSPRSFQARSLASLSWNSSGVGPTGTVDRAHSDRARSGSKGSARVSFHPFRRARSASKKDGCRLPIPHFRCRAFREHRTKVGVPPILFIEQFA